MFEGTWLTQLLQVVTAGRLFLVYKGQVNPFWMSASTTNVSFGRNGFLLQVSLQVTTMA